MRQRPAPFFLWSVGHVVARALRLDTATHDHRQLPEAIQLRHRAMAVVGYPQRLTALLTLLFQRGQRHRVRRFGTRGSGSSSHAPSPVGLTTPFFFPQATPPVKSSLPFSLREKVQQAVRTALISVLAAEVDAFIGAVRYERSERRQDYRNGHYHRSLD